MPLRSLIIAAVLLATCPRLASAQVGSFTCEPPQLIGILEGLNNPTAMTIDGNYAYIIENQNDLAIVDLSNPSDPVLRSRITIPQGPYDSVSIHETAAYCFFDDHLAIINIEDKADPWFVRFYYTVPYFEPGNTLAISDTHIYADNQTPLNIERPLAPGPDRFFNDDFVFESDPIGIFDNILFTSDFFLYDVTQPLDPIQINQHSFYSDYIRIEPLEEDGLLIATHEEYGIAIYDPQQQDSMHAILQQTGIDGPRGVALRGSILYAGGASLQAFSYGRPSLLIADFAGNPGLDNLVRIQQVQGRLITLNQQGTLAVYEPPRTNPIGSQFGHPNIEQIDISGNYLIATSDDPVNGSMPDSSSLYDITDPTRPIRTATLPVFDSRNAFIVDGMAIALSRTQGLHLIDITDPINPALLSQYQYDSDNDPKTTDLAYDFAISQDHAYVVYSDGSLVVLDISDPNSITPTAELEHSEFLRFIHIQDQLAFISGNNNLIIVDIQDPANPITLSSIERAPNTAYRIVNATRQGELLYTAEADNGYRIFDISDPTDPVQLAHFDTNFTTPNGNFVGLPREIQLIDDTMIIAMSSAGLAIFDNTQPFAPVLVRHAPAVLPQLGSESYYRDFAIRDNLLYTAAGNAGIRIYDLNDCALPCLADLNNDGQLNFFDVSVFLVAFSNQEPLADINNDGSYDFFDVSAFLIRFQAGCP